MFLEPLVFTIVRFSYKITGKCLNQFGSSKEPQGFKIWTLVCPFGPYNTYTTISGDPKINIYYTGNTIGTDKIKLN